jgi:hypothetical protein
MSSLFSSDEMRMFPLVVKLASDKQLSGLNFNFKTEFFCIITMKIEASKTVTL